jgi:hypothetical protein
MLRYDSCIFPTPDLVTHCAENCGYESILRNPDDLGTAFNRYQGKWCQYLTYTCQFSVTFQNGCLFVLFRNVDNHWARNSAKLTKIQGPL